MRRSHRTAQGATAGRDVVRIELRDDEGRAGIGEASPLPAHGTESLEHCARSLSRLAETLPAACDSRLDAAAAAAGLGPAAQWALDTAEGDLAARVAGRSLAAHWACGEGALPQALRVSALLHEQSPTDVASEAERAAEAGHEALKLKVGVAELAHDTRRLAAVRDAVGIGIDVRLDANGSWSPAEARRALDAWAVFSPAFVEQPLAPGEDAAMPALVASSPVPLALDESVVQQVDLSALVAAGAGVWVLKPAATGLRRARALHAEARARGIEVVWSSFLDGPVSVGALLHLASAMGAGAALGLDHLVEPAWPVTAGRVRVPEGPGLGRLPT